MYFAHIQQFVSFLRGGIDRHAASRVLNAFLNSVDGRAIKESHGGYLISAMEKGSLDKMMYAYSCRGGSPSQFVNLDGMKALVEGIPDVGEDVKTRMNELWEGYHHFLVSKLTPEQCSKEDNEVEMEEVCTSGAGGRYSGDVMLCEQTTVVSWKELNELKVSVIQSEAERKYLLGRLDLEEERKRLCQASKATEIELAVAKEHVVRVEAIAKEQLAWEKERSDRAEAAAKEQVEREKERAALAEAVTKERFEREKLQQQTAFLQEKAALELKMKEMEQAAFEARMKELEAANARMQLELEKARSAANGEGGSFSGGNTSRKRAQEPAPETEDNEEGQVEPFPRAVTFYAGGNALMCWLVAYEGDVELTFSRVQAIVPLLLTIESARFDGPWFSLLRLKKRLRGAQIMRAMHMMGLEGSVWVEAFAGCTTGVGFNIPVCNEHASSRMHILTHMKTRQRESAQFVMLLVKE